MPAIEKRIRAVRHWTQFQSQNEGHSILLITGLCQEFGALILKEIRDSLTIFGVNTDRLQNFMYCAELFGWVRKVRKGNNIFYVTTGGDQALEFNLTGSYPIRDKLRWRSDIRQFWSKEDNTRFRAITQVTTSTVDR